MRKCLSLFERALAAIGVSIPPKVVVVPPQGSGTHVAVSADKRTITLSSDFFDHQIAIPLYTLVRTALCIESECNPGKTWVIDFAPFQAEMDAFERSHLNVRACAVWNRYAELHNAVMDAMRLPACSVRS